MGGARGPGDHGRPGGGRCPAGRRVRLRTARGGRRRHGGGGDQAGDRLRRPGDLRRRDGGATVESPGDRRARPGDGVGGGARSGPGAASWSSTRASAPWAISARPTRLFRVVGAESGFTPRARVARQPTPFVGREEEVRLLAGRWERAAAGEGQMVLVSGEAGIGKSRLVEEFRRGLGDRPHRWIECAGTPLTANTPFHAVSEMLRLVFDFQSEDSDAERLERVRTALAGCRRSARGGRAADRRDARARRLCLLALAPGEKRRPRWGPWRAGCSVRPSRWCS